MVIDITHPWKQRGQTKKSKTVKQKKQCKMLKMCVWEAQRLRIFEIKQHLKKVFRDQRIKNIK